MQLFHRHRHRRHDDDDDHLDGPRRLDVDDHELDDDLGRPACTDTADQTALGTHMATLNGDVSTCTLDNITSGASAIAMCVAMKDGLSMACSACFGTYGACGASHCLSQCTTDAGASAPGCSSCIATNCGPAFVTCSGLSPTQGDAGTGGGGTGGSAADAGPG